MDYSSYFDIPSTITYLNTPGNGLMPRTHYAWRGTRDSIFFDPKSDLRDQQNAFMRDVGFRFASLFGCPLTRLFLIPNFSFGFNTLLAGLPKTLKFAMLADDYPSLNYPVISRGFDFALISVTDKVEENIYEYVQAHKPDVLLLSIVNYINGLKIDLSFIRKLKEDFPSLLIIADATQFLGTAPFDFDSAGFDAVGGSGYKWMMAGFGNGYMMISERLAALLYSEAHQVPRPAETMWAHKSILNIYFEPGHQDTLSHGTLAASVDFMKQVGLDNINEHLQTLMGYGYTVFEKRGWLLPIIAARQERSSLINLQIDPQLYPLLSQAGIKCFPRGTGVRIGLHLYNTKEDINRLVDVIDTVENEFKNR